MNILTIAGATLLLGCASNAGSSGPRTATNIKDTIHDVPTWLVGTECPANVITQSVEIGDMTACVAGAPDCLRKCQDGDPTACYGAALFHEARQQRSMSDGLFLQACKLGVASGCTNRAASTYRFTMNPTLSESQCVVSTFDKTCTLQDAWGCTMFAMMLMHGTGVSIDLVRARSVLEQSCIFGEHDDACKTARTLREELDQIQNGSASSLIPADK
jgi:hypothetical protein